MTGGNEVTRNRTYQFMRHVPCPKCGSDDNLSVTWCPEAESEAVYCNTPDCNYQLPPEQVNGEYEEEEMIDETQSNQEINLPEAYKKPTKQFRGIKPDTLNRFGVYLDQDKRIVFPFHDAEHNLIGYKTVNPKEKDFQWGAKKGIGMFGVSAAHSKYRLFVTEGEWDAMALKDLTGDCAVSVSSGAKSLVREYKAMMSYIESFDDVFVVMDNDEAGQKAMQNLKPIVSQAKVHFVQLPSEVQGKPVKDINDILKVARTGGDFDKAKRRFLDAVYASKNAVPETVYDNLAEDIIGDMFIEDDSRTEASTGMEDLDQTLGGWRKGEMTTILAPTSIGKSTFVRAITASLINRGYKVMLFSLEEPPRVTVRKIVELLKGDEIYYAETREQAKKKVEEVTDCIICHNSNGKVPPDTLEKDIDFAVRGQDAEFVVLDNLTRAIDQSDPYNSTNTFLDKITSLSVSHNVHSFVVSHTKRTDSSTNAPDIQEARGSGLIESFSSNIISLGRNRNENRMKVSLLKNREYGVLTDFYLDYNPSTKRFENLNYYDQPEGGEVNTDAKTQQVQREEAVEEEPVREEQTVTVARTGANRNESREEKQQSQGTLQISIGERTSVRQQGGSEVSPSNGRRGGDLPPDEQLQGQSTRGGSEDRETVPGLHDSNDQGDCPPRSERTAPTEPKKKNDGDWKSGEGNGVPIRYQASRSGRQDDSGRWILEPGYTPPGLQRQKPQPEHQV